MMDGKMKGMIMSGMMALCLVLGIMAVLGGAWLNEGGDDADDAEEMGQTTTYGLNTIHMEWDLEKMNDEETSEKQCEEGAKSMVDDNPLEGIEAECDGAIMSISAPLSELCDMFTESVEDAKDAGATGDDLKDTEESRDDACASATAGTIGTIGMWGGVVFALLATLMLVLPMAGVDAMDAMPDMGKMITSWGAGGLMLVGILAWYLMLPSGEATTGMTLWMAIGAAVLGLAAPAMDQFMPSDE
jgi:hypothetical protein